MLCRVRLGWPRILEYSIVCNARLARKEESSVGATSAPGLSTDRDRTMGYTTEDSETGRGSRLLVVNLAALPGLFKRLMRINPPDLPLGYAEQDAPPRYENNTRRLMRGHPGYSSYLILIYLRVEYDMMNAM